MSTEIKEQEEMVIEIQEEEKQETNIEIHEEEKEIQEIVIETQEEEKEEEKTVIEIHDEEQQEKEEMVIEILEEKEETVIDIHDEEQQEKESESEQEKESEKESETDEETTTIEVLEELEEPEKQEISIIDAVVNTISKIEDTSIVLLREREVIQWLFGDLSFLPQIEKKNKSSDNKLYKVLEDDWGRIIMKKRRPDLKLDKQWTNKFGEHICEELMYLLHRKRTTIPKKKNGLQPDLETDSCMIECKAGTFYTAGTAAEKILGSPFKYAEVPDLYKKPLQIVCMGGAEKVCRESYGNLPGKKCTAQKQKVLDFFRELKIEYMGATNLLIQITQPPPLHHCTSYTE